MFNSRNNNNHTDSLTCPTRGNTKARFDLGAAFNPLKLSFTWPYQALLLVEKFVGVELLKAGLVTYWIEQLRRNPSVSSASVSNVPVLFQQLSLPTPLRRRTSGALALLAASSTEFLTALCNLRLRFVACALARGGCPCLLRALCALGNDPIQQLSLTVNQLVN